MNKLTDMAIMNRSIENTTTVHMRDYAQNMRTTKYILTLILMTLIYTAQSQTMTIIDGKDSIDLTDQYYYEDTSLFYFPTGILIDTVNVFNQIKDSSFFSRRNESAFFTNTWFSEQLTGLKEPKLNGNYDFEVFRFTWLRTFHNPISFRIEKQNNEFLLFVKRANGAGGYDPGELIVSDTIKITENQWKNLIELIETDKFWNISTVEKKDYVSTDGSEWIFEARTHGKYHMVFRQNGKESEIGDLCLYLYELSGIKIKKREFY
jgi:hypothetical protein